MSLVLTDDDFQRVAKSLGVPEASVRAVAEVEASGKAFLDDGRPVILYEAHVFHRQTRGKFEGQLDRHGVALSSQTWNRSLYGRTGSHQHDRLDDAAKMDWDAAHKACSWGMFQILGENCGVIGTIEEFVEAMKESAARQLDAFVGFIQQNHLTASLRDRNWDDFARRYNGPGYKQNQYDVKLAQAYARWSSS